MKYSPAKILLPVLSLASLILVSCGTSAKAASINQLAPEVNTAVAATLTAEPTNTPVPTSTPTLTPTPTATPTATATPTLTPVPAYSYPVLGTACYDAAYIADVTIPDYSEVAPGETFRKTWLLENTGSCAWDQNFRMGFISGYDLSGDPKKLSQIVEPGQEAYLTVDFTAPDAAGEYTSYWRLSTREGALFGTTVYVIIDVPYDLVVAPTATSVPTNTPVPTATATLTPTPVPMTPTLTPPPSTNTPTPTPVPVTPTLTPVPSTNTPTPTPVPVTSTPTPVPTMTSTPTLPPPKNTPTPMPTPTLQPPTNTPMPTPAPTDTPVPTPTRDHHEH